MNEKPTSFDDCNTQMLGKYFYSVCQFEGDHLVEWKTQDDMAACLCKATNNMNGNCL